MSLASEEKKYSSVVMWSEVEMVKNFSSEVKPIPQVKVSSFSSKISSSSLIEVPIVCLKICLGLWNLSNLE